MTRFPFERHVELPLHPKMYKMFVYDINIIQLYRNSTAESDVTNKDFFKNFTWYYIRVYKKIKLYLCM